MQEVYEQKQVTVDNNKKVTFTEPTHAEELFQQIGCIGNL